jgi:Skp family chaperone for outer membrane proteins
MKTKFEEYRVQLETLERDEFQKVREKIDRAVASASTRLRIELVLEKQWVYYPANMYDMTGDVLKELGEK